MTISESMRDSKHLQEMGHRGRVLAEQSYDRRLITRRFAEFLETILPGASAAPPRSDETEAAPISEIESVATMPGEGTASIVSLQAQGWIFSSPFS